MDTFTREWTYRTPLVTTNYPKGWVGTLPKAVQMAARRAKALVPPTISKEARDGNEGAAKTRAPRRARKVKG